MNKDKAINYILTKCTKCGLWEDMSEFYIKINKLELTWNLYELFDIKFKKLGFFKKIYDDIFKVNIETRILINEFLDLIYDNNCEIIENDYLDSKYKYNISFKLIELLEEYFTDINTHNECQFGPSLCDNILDELENIKNKARGN